MGNLRRRLGVPLVIVAVAVLASLWLQPAEAGRRRAWLQMRFAPVVLNSFYYYTNQQIVNILRGDFGPTHILPNSVAIRPVGHPDFSAADCNATPNSLGCRARDIRTLAASQGTDGNRICMAFRPDVHHKLPGYSLDFIDGVSFDPAWLIRIPGDEFEARMASDFRNGQVYTPGIDGNWANGLEDACCHNGPIGDCTDQDQCLMRYGWSDDVTQLLWTVTLAGDLRIPAYREWTAGRLLARVADAEADCATVHYKPGWWAHYDGPPSYYECFRPEDNNWAGSRPYDPCAKSSSPVFPTPYGPGEYEAGLNALFDEIFAQMQSKGQSFPLITAERPEAEGVIWGWMGSAHVQNPGLLGEFKTNVQPYIEPGIGLVAYMTPPPEHGVAPHLDVDITVDVRGNAVGPTDIRLWCDCNVTSTDVATVQASCGTTPGEYHEFLGLTTNLHVVADACDYPAVGTYVPKVLVERQGLAREDRIAVNVD